MREKKRWPSLDEATLVESVESEKEKEEGRWWTSAASSAKERRCAAPTQPGLTALCEGLSEGGGEDWTEAEEPP